MPMTDAPTAKGHNKLADALADAKARFSAANPERLARWESARFGVLKRINFLTVCKQALSF